jgi:hypothetical protein
MQKGTYFSKMYRSTATVKTLERPDTNSKVYATIMLMLLGLAVMIVLRSHNLPEGGAVPAYLNGYETHADNDAAPSAYRWNKTDLTYSIANCPPSLDCEAAREAVRQAARAWDDATALTLTEVPADGDIVVSWAASGYGNRHFFDGPGGKVAQTYYPYSGGAVWYDGDIILDESENWVTGTPTQGFPYQVHLPTTVMHEMGHALGLPHSSVQTSVMWPVYTGVRGLAPSDVANAQALYGAPAIASQ